MSNVLGNLFEEIANAIREKTGGTDTMKPAEFPAEIASIPVGGGGGEWISATGSFKPTSNTYVLNHNLGVAPDIFFIYYFASNALTGTTSLLMCGMALSQKLIGDAVSSGAGYSYVFNPNTKIPMIFGITQGLESLASGAFGGIGGATPTQITLGSSIANLITGGEYKWTAHAMK